MNRIRIGRRVLGACVLIGLLGTFAAVSQAYPEPHIVPTSWELEFEHRKPELISVRLPGEDTNRLYHYFTYTVTNRTGDERLWVPDFWVLTDAGDLIQANRGISPAVFNAIKARERNALLETPVQVVGRLLQGRDNARDGMVIWPVPNHDVDNMRIFVGGLSGETHVVKDPAGGEDKLLRKTLMLEYNTPGDYAHLSQKPFVFVEKQWIVR